MAILSEKQFSFVELPDRVKLPNVIAIEGNSGSGKSTVSSLFSDLGGFMHVGEYGHFIDWDRGEKFPSFPPNSEFEVRASSFIWKELELRRRSYMLRSEDKDLVVIMERSLLSLLAFEYAKNPLIYNCLLPTLDIICEEIYYSNMEHLLLQYQMLFECQLLSEPSAYIYLDVDHEVSSARVKARSGKDTLGFLYHDSTVKLINHFSKWFLYNFIPNDKVLIIDSRNNTTTQIYHEIQEFINSQEKLIPLNGFKLLTDFLLKNT